MTKLEDLTPNATLRGLLADGNATAVVTHGPEVLERNDKGRTDRYTTTADLGSLDLLWQLVDAGLHPNFHKTSTSSRLIDGRGGCSRIRTQPLQAGSAT